MVKWRLPLCSKSEALREPIDIKHEIDDSRHRVLRADDVRYLVVHRISLSRLRPLPIADEYLRGEDIVREFRDRALGTGGRTPYHALILVDGTIVQLLPLSARGAHAVDYNWQSIGVAVVGLLDEQKMNHGQFASLVHALKSLQALYPAASIQGHTELPHASRDPNKRCPGRFVSMHAIRTQVECQMDTRAGWVV